MSVNVSYHVSKTAGIFLYLNYWKSWRDSQALPEKNVANLIDE